MDGKAISIKDVYTKIDRALSGIDKINEKLHPFIGTKVGDIILYDSNQNKKLFTDVDHLNDYDNTRYSAVGVVADTESNLNKIGIISLAEMSGATPNTGVVKNPTTIVWGEQSVIIGHNEIGIDKIDGKRRTSLIINSSKDNNWKSSSAISTGPAEKGVFNTAQCTWRYYTKGTQQGDWYLPADKERITACSNKHIINESFDKLNEWAGNIIAVKLIDYYYWTSSEHVPSLAVCINIKETVWAYVDKGAYAYARAFLQLNL